MVKLLKDTHQQRHLSKLRYVKLSPKRKCLGCNRYNRNELTSEVCHCALGFDTQD